MIRHIAVAYYPEHCAEERWPRDLALMKANGIDAVRILEFAWSRMETGDGLWDFGWVHRFMALAAREGIRVIPCTPSASPPPWLTLQNPDCLMMNPDGRRATHGARRHYCPSSATYRRYCRRIAERMQRELGRYDSVIAWQIDNELGFNRCHCPECASRFGEAVRCKYGTLEALNRAWGGAFWSVEYYDWDHVTLPGGNASPEARQEFLQFYSDAIIDFMKEQRGALRGAGCAAPITTNMMGNFDQIDYWEMARHVDFIGWDNYWFLTTLSSHSFTHHLMRSLKGGAPYWTFENGVETYPGFSIVEGLSALAHGEEVHTIFRWDSCPFGHEMDLQGLVDWSGAPRAKLGEMKKLRGILDEVRALFPGSPREPGGGALPPLEPRVAIVVSYQNYWATDRYYGSYWNEVNDYYQALFDLGLSCDCVPPSGELGRYDLVLAPGLALVSDDDIAAFRRYVEQGGTLVAGRKTFSKLPCGSYRREAHPAMTNVFGLRVAETQSDEDTVDIAASIYKPPFPKRRFALRGEGGLPEAATRGWFETLAPDTAETLYRYADGDFPGAAAVCRNRCGKGQALYVGVMPDRAALRAIVRLAAGAAGIQPVAEVPQGAEVVRRGDCCFVLNFTAQPLAVPLPGPWRTLLGARWDAGDKAVQLPPFGYSIVSPAGPPKAGA